jgi:kinesin family protein 5
MSALAEGRAHIPYRDSKLTRLLQNSLGGSSRTSVIVTIPQGEDGTGEVLNALKFASRASKVKVAAKVLRFTDFEGLYNIAQKALDIQDQKDRNHENLVIITNDKNEKLENEIMKLKDEIKTLKNQLNYLVEGDVNDKNSYNGTNEIDNKDTNNDNDHTNNNNDVNISNNKIQYQDKVQELISEHLKNLEDLRYIYTYVFTYKYLYLDIDRYKCIHVCTDIDMYTINIDIYTYIQGEIG